MKIILERDGVKRQITGPFAMCIGDKDLARLVDVLTAERDRRTDEGVVYGWFIVAEPVAVSQIPSTPPLLWTE